MEFVPARSQTDAIAGMPSLPIHAHIIHGDSAESMPMPDSAWTRAAAVIALRRWIDNRVSVEAAYHATMCHSLLPEDNTFSASPHLADTCTPQIPRDRL